MIRAKHISNLSSTARSFFLNGSRPVADGNSCAYTDDETCVSRRQQLRNDAAQTEKRPPGILPKPSVVGCILPGGEVTKPVVPKKVDDFGRPSLLPQHVSSSPALPLKSHSVSYASTIVGKEEGKASSEPIGDQIFKAGVVAVNFLSDLANCKIPSTDGGGEVFGFSKSCMVDPTRPLSSVKSSNVKAIRREHFAKVYPRSAAKESSVGKIRNSSSNVRGAKEAERTGFVKGFKQVSNSGVGKSLPTTNNTYGKRTSVLQRPNIDSNRFVPNGFSNTSMEMVKGPPGTALTSRQYCNSGYIVENVSSVLRRFRWGPAAEEALQNLDLRIDAYQANQVLKQMNDYGNALGFFYWLKRQPGFKHDGHTYTTMVGNLGRAKQFGAINKLLDEMVRDGCQPNTVTYNRLIHSYGRANYLNEAMNVFNQMQETGCKPDRVTYCTLIDIHAKAGFLDIAMDMYQRMQAGGLSPDTFTYSVIINCLGKAGHLPAAHRLFCEMVDQGCTPNLVTYNIMIDLHAKARNYQSALKLYRDMQNAGFEPDKVTYSIVMEVLGHCGYLEEAEAVFTEMQQKNWIPDEPVYGLLVDLWGKAGNVEKAWQWYQAMLHAGLLPNVPTCNSLLSTFLRVNKIAEAYELLQNMLGLGLRPSLQTYTLLLSSCTDGRSKLDMGFCGQLMANTGHPAHMFLLKMPAAGPDGQNVRNHANNFLNLMHSEDRESKRGLVDAVVDFLHKSGQKEEAGSVWEVAAQKNVFPDALREKSCSYWLINLHVMSEGTAVTALSRTLAWFRKQMLVSGTCPSRIDIVTGWGRRSRVTGTSMVRQAVEELLNIFGSPFFTESGNSGCFVGCGESLNKWLLQSHVERMHLL
ncbi:PREDICTED: pentatricopeptide repeat-containing protein At1g18900 [Camelina sativa]|uniref:Pentatricopeptide repeat-containing protein At1g18900 n=2 Tax=Camelina sativa TaxID=90675 RepID=A0ABM0VQ66_CAMSA|nr:PREDICTED: pentatricopeptide repeat-containing protein At1g18900 [Camelina sativa]XP_010459538.1 PREDICTED: pentatricopeptide repeat-containing protein At1g18900 [Camelina sativa]